MCCPDDGPAMPPSGSEAIWVGCVLNPAELEDRVEILRELPDVWSVLRRLRSRSRSMPSIISFSVRLRTLLEVSVLVLGFVLVLWVGGVGATDSDVACSCGLALVSDVAFCGSCALPFPLSLILFLRRNAVGLTFSLSRQTISSSDPPFFGDAFTAGCFPACRALCDGEGVLVLDLVCDKIHSTTTTIDNENGVVNFQVE